MLNLSQEQQKNLDCWDLIVGIFKSRKKFVGNSLKIVGTLIPAIESGRNQKKLHSQPRNEEATQIEKKLSKKLDEKSHTRRRV